MNGSNENGESMDLGESCSTEHVFSGRMPQSPTIHFETARFEIPKPRPTREAVLKRLYEALMRRSLTKIDLSQRGLRSSDAKLVKLALLQNSKLSVLKLGYNNLGDEGVISLSAGVMSHRLISTLDLGFNQFGDGGCRALATALQASSVSTLYLAGNLFQEEGAVALADAIRSGCALQKLHLTGNRIGPDGVAAITSAIIESELRGHEGGVSELFLGGTSMGPVGCHAVSRMLERSSSIRVISLANCGIGDEEVAGLASSIRENRERLPLQALQLSFNTITCKGLDSLTNALWGSRTLRELLLDNNEIGERGGQQLANILPHIRTLQILDVGFNSIKPSGMRNLMKVVAETQNLLSLSVSGNPIDTHAAKAVAYALAYNRSLKSVFLDHCLIEHEGQRHIVAGVVSNSGISLRKLTGFLMGPVIVTIGLPAALENWTNEQVLNFVQLMWNQTHDTDTEVERELDPLNFLSASGDEGGMVEPIDAPTVVEVAKRAFTSLGSHGERIFARTPDHRHSFDSPLTEDAIMVESIVNGLAQQQPKLEEENEMAEGMNDSVSSIGEGMPANGPKSFIAQPAEPARVSIPDPARKKKIVDWLCQNIQHLNELAQIPFDSGELWRLHQHYFTPVVKEVGGNTGANGTSDVVNRMINSVPEVPRGFSVDVGRIVTPSTQSGEDTVIPQSDPSLTSSPQAATLPILKRKVSYRFLGEAALSSQTRPQEERINTSDIFDGVVAKMIESGPGMHSLPPKTKRARRNKSRVSFLPRIKEKLDSYLDMSHDKALILMRQLKFVETALLDGRINPEIPPDCPTTHLSGVLANEAEMILVDMM